MAKLFSGAWRAPRGAAPSRAASFRVRPLGCRTRRECGCGRARRGGVEAGHACEAKVCRRQWVRYPINQGRRMASGGAARGESWGRAWMAAKVDVGVFPPRPFVLRRCGSSMTRVESVPTGREPEPSCGSCGTLPTPRPLLLRLLSAVF